MSSQRIPQSRTRPRAGLDEDAYSNARSLYETTEDIRYAVIAIGKTRGDKLGWPDGIPEWAIQACQRFAEVVREATPLERKKLSVHSRLPRQSANEALYRKVVAALEAGAQDFASACRKVGIEDESLKRNLRRKYNKELLAGPPSAPLAERHQRILEASEARVRLRRYRQKSDGQKREN